MHSTPAHTVELVAISFSSVHFLFCFFFFPQDSLVPSAFTPSFRPPCFPRTLSSSLSGRAAKRRKLNQSAELDSDSNSDIDNILNSAMSAMSDEERIDIQRKIISSPVHKQHTTEEEEEDEKKKEGGVEEKQKEESGDGSNMREGKEGEERAPQGGERTGEGAGEEPAFERPGAWLLKVERLTVSRKDLNRRAVMQKLGPGDLSLPMSLVFQLVACRLLNEPITFADLST